MNDHELEKLLDRALSEYSEARPRTGLEQRILANLESRSNQRVGWRWRWAALPVLAALIIVAVLLGLRTRTPKPVEVAHVPEANTTAPAVPAKAIAPVAHEHPRPHRKVAHRSTPPTPVQQQPPRLATFPSRDGDDELVRLAVRFVQTQPAVAAQITQEQNDFRQMAEAFTAPLRSSSDQKTSEER